MKVRDFFLQFADNVLCVYIFFPAMVCYWRGIWDLLGIYIRPENELKTIWICFALGLLDVFSYFVAPVLDRILDRDNRVQYVFVTRVFMYAHSFLFMCWWRGVWSVADYYSGHEWRSSLICLIVCIFLLVMLRGLRNTMWPPFIAFVDTREDVLVPYTRFGTTMEKSPFYCYLLDSCFSQWVIWGLSILVWRSAWNIMGIIIFPENRLKSDVFSLFFGTTMCLIMLTLQTPLGMISERLGRMKYKIWKILFEDFIYLCAMVVLFLAWHGGWYLNATYMLGDLEIGGWVNHVIGTLALMSYQVYSYVGAVGVVVDGADPGGSGIFQNRYLREFFDIQEAEKKKRSISRNSQLNTIVQSKSNGGGSVVMLKYDLSSEAPPGAQDDDISLESLDLHTSRPPSDSVDHLGPIDDSLNERASFINKPVSRANSTTSNTGSTRGEMYIKEEIVQDVEDRPSSTDL